MDETGTISPPAGLLLTTPSPWESTHEDQIRTRIREEMAVRSVLDDILQVHGVPPGSKHDGTFRLFYENANGLDGRYIDNHKIRKARYLHDKLEAGAVAYNEHRLNFRHKDNPHGLSRLFCGEGSEMRLIAAHNVHENQRRIQEGGTSLLLFGPTVQYFTATESGKDETGLGRWSVITLSGNDGFNTRIICRYNPCGNSWLDTGTVYAQHRCFYLLRGCLTCPRVKFRQDLVTALSSWRAKGDRLVVCLDANEDIYKKSIGKALTDKNGLGMREVVGTFTRKQIGATFFRGLKPIDGIWATSDITVTSACIMPAGFGIGDHRLFIVDFLLATLVGQTPTRIARPCARRLTTKLPGVIRA